MRRAVRFATGSWALIVGVALVFLPGGLRLSQVWAATDYYSHGFLVPAVAFFLFHARLPELPAPGAHPSGLWLLVAAGLVYAAGFLLGSPTALGLAVVAAVAALALRFWGAPGLRRLAFPVAFLLFMVPIPPAVLTPFILMLQTVVSVAAVEILHALGFSVLREGNVVLLPGDGRLFVDEACSGITSIVTLLPLGAILARFTEQGIGRRMLLLALVVPVAMLGNLVRVLVTVLVANTYGVERATSGMLHDSAGLLTFALACGLLIGCGALLRLVTGVKAFVRADA